MRIRTVLSGFLAYAFIALVVFVPEADASIISISKGGQIMIKVLSAQTSSDLLADMNNDSLEVTKIQNSNLSDPSVAINKKDGKVSMTVLSDGHYKELDVTGVGDDLVEVEQRPEVQKLTISADSMGFNLKQGSFIARTPYSIEVDAKTARFALTTERGKEFVSVLPLEAVESAMRSGLLTSVTDNNIGVGNSNENLSYTIVGKKVFNILNLTEYSIPVSVSVSANDGHVVAVDSTSPFYKVLKVFFL